MEKSKKENSIWRKKDKPRPVNQCSSGVTFYPKKIKKEKIEGG